MHYLPVLLSYAVDDKDLGSFPYQSAQWKSIDWTCRMIAQILRLHYHVSFSVIRQIEQILEHFLDLNGMRNYKRPRNGVVPYIR